MTAADQIARLPFDVARCAGTTADLCQSCRRREPSTGLWQSHISQQWTVNGCANYIAPDAYYVISGSTNVSE